MVDASENDTIQRRWQFHMEAVRPSHGIIHPSEPRLHPSVGAAASSIHHTLYHALSHPPSPHFYSKAERDEQSKFVPANPQPPIQIRKPTNTTAPIIVPRRLDIIKRK
jgi:hypothetical protein